MLVYSVLNTSNTNNNTIYIYRRNKQAETETSKQTKKIERSIKTIKEVLKRSKRIFSNKVENIFDRDDRKYIDNDETSSCIYTLFDLTIYC